MRDTFAFNHVDRLHGFSAVLRSSAIHLTICSREAVMHSCNAVLSSRHDALDHKMLYCIGTTSLI